MPGKILHSLLHLGNTGEGLAEFAAVLAQQLVASLLPGRIFIAHADDGLDLMKGEVQFFQFSNAVQVDDILVSIETLAAISAALGLEQAQTLIVANGPYRNLAFLGQLANSISLHTKCVPYLGHDAQAKVRPTAHNCFVCTDETLCKGKKPFQANYPHTSLRRV